VTWVCTFMLWQRRHRLSLLLLGAAISLSTLVTKQHLIVDVIGGVGLAWLCVAAVTRSASASAARLRKAQARRTRADR
jgi:membrane-associated phospholipid phosphatase